MRRLFQFRLRTLFVLLTITAIAALWWSHRLHCLGRAAFHRAEIVRCQEQQARDKDEFVARTKPLDSRRIRFEILKAMSRKSREHDLETPEEKEKRRAELLDALRKQALSRSPRWEDQSLNDSMAQGYLVVPSDPPKFSPSKQYTDKKQVLDTSASLNGPQPDIAEAYEAKAVALHRDISLHAELADQYMRAIYRPWMRVDESELSETKSP